MQTVGLTELEGDIEGRGEQAGPSGGGHGGATCQNLPDLIPHSSTLCAADLWGAWDTASVWGEGPHAVWLALTAEAGLGVGPMKGMGRCEERDIPRQAQPGAQMHLADGWKVLSEAGSGLVFTGELTSRELYTCPHHGTPVIRSFKCQALNMVLHILCNRIFTNPMKPLGSSHD